MKEYYDLHKERNGDIWFTVTTVVEDPKYLTEPFVTSTDFKKEPDGADGIPRPAPHDDERFSMMKCVARVAGTLEARMIRLLMTRRGALLVAAGAAFLLSAPTYLRAQFGPPPPHRRPARQGQSRPRISPATGCPSSPKTGAGAW